MTSEQELTVKPRSWWEGPVCTLVVAVCILVTFGYIVVGFNTPRIFGTADIWNLYGPNNYFMDNALHHGEVPLWNPLIYCGTPFAANPANQLFYPPNLLRSLLTFNPTPLRTHQSYAIFLFLHMLLAGVGAYYLARSHRLGFMCSLIAGVALVCSTEFVRRVMIHPVFYSMTAWIPWFLWLLRRIIEEPAWRRKVIRGTWAGLVFGLILLGGFPQQVLYIGMTAAVYVAANVAVGYFPRDKDIKSRNVSGVPSTAAVMLLVIVIGIGLAMIAWYPALQFASLSSRTKASPLHDVYNEASIRNIPPLHFMQFLRGMVTYPGVSYGLIESPYSTGGVLMIVLAALSILHRRRREVLAYALIAYCVIDCSFGTWPVGRFIAWVAPFKLGAQSYAWIHLTLPLAMMTAFGAHALTTDAARTARYLRSGLVVALGGGALALLVTNPKAPIPVTPLRIAIPAFGVLACALMSMRSPSWALRGLICVLLFAESLAWNVTFVPTVFKHFYGCFPYPVTAYDTPRAFWNDNRRGVTLLRNLNMYDLRGDINGYDPLHLLKTYLTLCPPNLETQYWRQEGPEVITGNERGNLFLKRPFWLARQYVKGPLPGKLDLFPATTTVYLKTAPKPPVPEVARDQVPHHCLSSAATTVFSLDEHALSALHPVRESQPGSPKWVFRFPTVHVPPRDSALLLRYRSSVTGTAATKVQDPVTKQKGYLMTFSITPTPAQGTVVELPLPDFRDQRYSISLEHVANANAVRFISARLETDPADEDNLIHVLRRSANCVELKVGPLPGNRILTFVSAAYPGWRATVDGRPVSLIKADNDFKAVALAPGVHHVVFAYSAVRVRLGAALSGLTLAAAIAVLVWMRTRTGVTPGMTRSDSEGETG